jgi:hypothetical protein
MSDQTLEQEFLDLFGKLNENDATAQDQLFSNGRFFPGNVAAGKHLPYDRFEHYESLLKLVAEKFPEKFLRVHKGTPYYFLAWTAFDFRDYERAVFYMDAAISEDMKNNPAGWHGSPAGHFMFLRKDETAQAAQRITARAYYELDEALKSFCRDFSATLTIDKLVNRFVHANLQYQTHRSVVTSLYSFVLEFKDRELQLNLRSAGGGSIEPFLLHLLKGCLIFESILKEVYTSMAGEQLGAILKNQFISQDLSYKSALIDTSVGVRHTLQDIVRHLLPFLQTEAPHNRAITLTYAVRNVTSHSLLWPDVFPQHYADLYRAIVFAVFYVINKKY